MLDVPGVYANSFTPGGQPPNEEVSMLCRHPRLSRRSGRHVVDAGGGRRADGRPARVHHRLTEEGLLGLAARLGPTNKASTLRGPAGLVVDGPFAETKEQLLGFYTIDCGRDRRPLLRLRAELRRVNPSAVYEIRPVIRYLPGVAFRLTEAETDGVISG